MHHHKAQATASISEDVYLRLLLENHNAPPLVPGGQQLPGVVEFNGGDDVSCQSQSTGKTSSDPPRQHQQLMEA